MKYSIGLVEKYDICVIDKLNDKVTGNLNHIQIAETAIIPLAFPQ